MPARRAQIAATAAASPGAGAPARGDGGGTLEQQLDGRRPSGRPPAERRARSGSTANSCSPRTRSGARLVASTVSPGHAGDQRGDVRRRVEQVLEVVEDEQQLAVAPAQAASVGDRVAARATDGASTASSDGRQHGVGVAQRRQLDVHHPVGEPVRHGAARRPAPAGSCRPRRGR